MNQPTDQQIADYASNLPAVYKAVLKSFVVDPGHRRVGDALTRESIDIGTRSHFAHYRSGDTDDAIKKLIQRNILESVIGFTKQYRPTEIGERLITALTGNIPIPAELPDVPKLTWA